MRGARRSGKRYERRKEVWEAVREVHGTLGAGLRPAWVYERRRKTARQSERCIVIWEAALDPHGGLRSTRRAGRRYERCIVIWEAALDPDGVQVAQGGLGVGMRGAWRPERRS